MALTLDQMQDIIERAIKTIEDEHAVSDCPSQFIELINMWLVIYDRRHHD